MDNLARKDELAQEFGSFLHMISSVSDVKALDQMCHEFLYRQAPQRGLELAAAVLGLFEERQVGAHGEIGGTDRNGGNQGQGEGGAAHARIVSESISGLPERL